MRLDQWLWAIRVFKSRHLAAEAIKSERVEVDSRPSKPAHEVRPGDVVTVHYWNRDRILRVLATPESRVPAKRVAEFAEDERPASMA